MTIIHSLIHLRVGQKFYSFFKWSENNVFFFALCWFITKEKKKSCGGKPWDEGRQRFSFVSGTESSLWGEGDVLLFDGSQDLDDDRVYKIKSLSQRQTLLLDPITLLRHVVYDKQTITLCAWSHENTRTKILIIIMNDIGRKNENKLGKKYIFQELINQF